MQVFLGLGSNIGDKILYIEKSIYLLKDKITNIKSSRIYETKPVGFTIQDNFLNTAISGDTTLLASELLKFVKEVEKKIGRIERFRWGPREIDIDIIFYGEQVYADNELEIPHPRAHERDFVLRPLYDLSSVFVHPIYKKTVKELLRDLPKSNSSVIRCLDP